MGLIDCVRLSCVSSVAEEAPGHSHLWSQDNTAHLHRTDDSAAPLRADQLWPGADTVGHDIWITAHTTHFAQPGGKYPVPALAVQTRPRPPFRHSAARSVRHIHRRFP